jgi:putative nucleotidyltransferase with HDIG domain
MWNYSRQTTEVFFNVFGKRAALDVVQQRRGKWFDPQLVDALIACDRDTAFWEGLNSDDLVTKLSRWEPEDAVLLTDEECLDRVGEAFAQVVDAKSPWTYEHSTRVAEITVGVAQQLGCSPELERDLRRAALLHDIGKLGVSNLILDKPGKPTDDELQQIRRHPEFTQRILERVKAFRVLADVAGAHHERLDGAGYHRGLAGNEIPWATRVLTVADVCESLSARRPYREAMDWDQIRKILQRDVGCAFDAECVSALERWHDRHALQSRVESQLREVDRMLEGL